MKKILVVLASLTLAVSAWGQSRVEAVGSERERADISDCAAAIAHRDAIKVLEANREPDTTYGEKVWSLTVLLLRDRGALRRGYYTLGTVHEIFPIYTVCWHIPLK